MVLPRRRVPLDQLGVWAKRHLRPTDQLALEATINAWDIYDQLLSLVSRVVVVDPAKTKGKIALPVKTDNRDTLAMAGLLASNGVPTDTQRVPRSATPCPQLRATGAHRERLIRQLTAAKNQVHNIVHRYNLVPPSGESKETCDSSCGSTIKGLTVTSQAAIMIND